MDVSLVRVLSRTLWIHSSTFNLNLNYRDIVNYIRRNHTNIDKFVPIKPIDKREEKLLMYRDIVNYIIRNHTNIDKFVPIKPIDRRVEIG